MVSLILFIFIFHDVAHKGLEAVQKEPKDDDESLPKLLVAGIALIGLGLLIANTALVAWFIIRKRIKGKKNSSDRAVQKRRATQGRFSLIFFCFI